MTRHFSIVKANPPDLETIRSLLARHGLITDDLTTGIDFYIGREAGQTIGIGGLEVYDTVALLRSVVMADAYRGKGLGRTWAQALMNKASQAGIKELYLLTTTAPGFFEKMGFETIHREQAPEAIQQTREFSELCPDSAVVMKKVLAAWTEEESGIFSVYADVFIPEREVQARTICEILEGVPRLDQVMDLCCGDGYLSGEILRCFPDVRVTGADASPHMLDKANQRLSNSANRFETQLFRLEQVDWRHPESMDALVSSLAIHHLNRKEKQILFRDGWKMLRPGGVFVIADIIRPARKVGERIAGNAWDLFVKNQSTNQPEIFRYFKTEGWNFYDDPDADPIDKPDSLKDQLDWMEQVGFIDVDVYWMKAGHAIFAGWKK